MVGGTTAGGRALGAREVRTSGNDMDKMLMFRDCLRSNDADRVLYERIKRDLAKQTWKYMQNYADAKTSIVEEVVERACAAR
jgi:GrpB-like predicted nucleotidyltransferase (UPF0157 family)